MDDFILNLKSLFLEQGFIIMLGCMIIGALIKGTFKAIPNDYIPRIMVVLAIILGFITPTYEDKDVVTKIILLASIGFSSTGFYEFLCTFVKTRFSIDINKILGIEDDTDKKAK